VNDGPSVRYLTLEEVLVLVRILGDPRIRDLGLLDSAVHRPRAAFAGQAAYPTIEEKAAALLHSVAKNHALVDGNKRLAWMACDVFLSLNGLRPGLTRAEAFDLVVKVAGTDTDVADIAAGLRVVPEEP
jgi:death-on-curing protein